MQYTIFIHLEQYLAQWLIHENGGEQPVRFRKGSVENSLLVVLLSKPPKNQQWVPQTKEGPGQVEIVLPYNKIKNIRYNYYLSRKGEFLLHEIIRNRFKVKLWKDLHTVGNVIRRNDELISSWMREHGIEDNDKNWNTIAKILQRTKKSYKKSTT